MQDLTALSLKHRRLFLRKHEVHMHIGVHDFEKHGTQRVLINVDLYVALATSTPTADALAEVVAATACPAKLKIRSGLISLINRPVPGKSVKSPIDQ